MSDCNLYYITVHRLVRHQCNYFICISIKASLESSKVFDSNSSSTLDMLVSIYTVDKAYYQYTVEKAYSVGYGEANLYCSKPTISYW